MGNVSTSSYFGLSGTAAARFLTWFHFEEKCAQAHLKTRAARGREHYSGFCVQTRAPRCLAGDHRHILVMKWIVAQRLHQLLSPRRHMALVGAAVWVCWACSFQLQARFYSITESYLKAAGPLPWPQHHLFLAKGKENRRFVVRCDEKDIFDKKRTCLLYLPNRLFN